MGTQQNLYYVHTDHLGSYNFVMDASKNIIQSCHFDPWGNRKLYNNWSQNNTASSFLFNRGFTSHEHLDVFKIVNMNARLYDPVIGRFFSPDPIIQDYEATQTLNRYSYCQNNPINRVDWTGLLDGWVEDPNDENHTVYWDPKIKSPKQAMKAGKIYHGQTANFTNEKGEVKYGDQYGHIHDATALAGVIIQAQDPHAGTRHLYLDDKGFGPKSWRPDAIQLEAGVSLKVAGIVNYSVGGGIISSQNHTGMYWVGSYTMIPNINDLLDMKYLKLIKIGPYFSLNLLENLTKDPSSINVYEEGGVTNTLGLGPLGLNYGQSANAEKAFRYGPFSPTERLYNAYGFTLNPGFGYSRTPSYIQYFVQNKHR